MKPSWGWWRKGVLKRVAGVAALVLVSGVVAASSSEKLSIVSATWKAQECELRVEGVSLYVGGAVFVRDEATKKLLGSAAVRADGKWVLKVRQPAVVPSRMRAEVGGAFAKSEVRAWLDAVTAVAAQLEDVPEP